VRSARSASLGYRRALTHPARSGLYALVDESAAAAAVPATPASEAKTEDAGDNERMDFFSAAFNLLCACGARCPGQRLA
jgi:hypothetical protein